MELCFSERSQDASKVMLTIKYHHKNRLVLFHPLRGWSDAMDVIDNQIISQ